jgi:5-methylcytosine-specific restriction endonuclease McrA
MAISTQGLPFAKPQRKKRKNRVRSKATRAVGKMRKELDAQARTDVFARDNYICVRCRKSGRGVQWCHIFSRRHPCLRWEMDNALTMCGGCHQWWHQYPLLSVDWFRKTWPDRYEQIMAVYQVNPKISVKELWLERCGEK